MAVAAVPIALEVLIAQEVLNNLVGQVVGQIVGAALGPEIRGLTEEMNKDNPNQQLFVADVVEAFIKGHMDLSSAVAEAKLNGYGPERLALLIASAGEPPALQFLTEAARRGFIPQAGTGAEAVSLEQGIRESRLKNKWIPTVEQMQFRLPDPGIVIEGWLRAQLSEQDAREFLRKNGVDETFATLWYKSSGRPPGPSEGIELARRGIIPIEGEGGDTLSLRQLFLETDIKNKWWEPWLRLMEYVPPPRTITALVRSGSLSDAQALTFFRHAGLTEELAAVYLANAHHERTAATRNLTKATILKLYAERLFTTAEAKTHLIAYGDNEATATFELEAQDFQREKGLLDHAVNRVRSFYVGHKIGAQVALESLTSLGVAKEQADTLMQVWTIERGDNVKTLTTAEILDLAAYGIEPEDVVLGMLQAEGFSALDAWYALNVKLKGNIKAAKPG